MQILTNACLALIYVIKMQTALILMAATHVPAMLVSLQMEKHAVCGIQHNLVDTFTIYIFILPSLQHVLMATYFSIMEPLNLTVLKKALCLFATTIHMAQCVMIDGMN